MVTKPQGIATLSSQASKMGDANNATLHRGNLKSGINELDGSKATCDCW